VADTTGPTKTEGGRYRAATPRPSPTPLAARAPGPPTHDTPGATAGPARRQPPTGSPAPPGFAVEPQIARRPAPRHL